MIHNIPNNLFILKHKDLDVAMVQINLVSGELEQLLTIYLPDELPIGCTAKNPSTILSWWKSRAIPDSRRGLQQALAYIHEPSSLTLMLSGYGLSLNDHYWMQPLGKELYWKNLNFFTNPFSDELGLLLTDSDKLDINAHISKFSPSSSVTGEMKKKWVIQNGIRYLMKISTNNYGQQSVNELIASHLHKRLGWSNYVTYHLETTKIDGKEVPCSLNPLFTSETLEFVPAYQLIRHYKIPNDQSVYEALIELAVKNGCNEHTVRKQLEYTILTDFILTNTDRHFNNFGFLYDASKKQFTNMAPIFDTGNSLFYDCDFIPSKEDLLNIRVNSFCQKETELLRYISDKSLISLDQLDNFPQEAQDLLTQYTNMPSERAQVIAETITQKIIYLNDFFNGKKIWKQKRYW